MHERERIARAAAVSNSMVWFGLSLFLGTFAAQLAPAAFAGEWHNIVGWALLVLAAVGLLIMGLVEQRTMRAARMKSRTAPVRGGAWPIPGLCRSSVTSSAGEGPRPCDLNSCSTLSCRHSAPATSSPLIPLPSSRSYAAWQADTRNCSLRPLATGPATTTLPRRVLVEALLLNFPDAEPWVEAGASQRSRPAHGTEDYR